MRRLASSDAVRDRAVELEAASLELEHDLAGALALGLVAGGLGLGQLRRG